MKIIKRLFCWHQYEHEESVLGIEIKVCRKCFKVRNV